MKTYNNTTEQQAQNQVKDLEVWGTSDTWKLISKASSKSERWMKSTKAMQLPTGVLIQVTTQQGDNVAEALQFVRGLEIKEIFDKKSKKVISRALVMNSVSSQTQKMFLKELNLNS